MGRPLFLSLVMVLAAGCWTEPPAPPRPSEVETDSGTPAGSLGRPAPPTPFDAEPIVFDTVEPPEQVVQIPPRPDPTPSLPAPSPTPTRPPPPPPGGGPSGSCDVRATEGYCFTYTGPGWTPAEAEANCDAAPSADFSPGTCPLTDRIATCVYQRSSAPEREIVYTYYAPHDVGLAELACPGAFTRLP